MLTHVLVAYFCLVEDLRESAWKQNFLQVIPGNEEYSSELIWREYCTTI